MSIAFFFMAWLFSMFLLSTFSYRYAAFDLYDVDSHLKIQPNNKFFLLYIFRKDYPDVRDYAGIMSLYKQVERDKCPLAVKERWFDYLQGKTSYIRYSDCEKEIYWQDMLLDSFKKLENGDNLEKGIYDIQSSILTCMISNGYVRQDQGKDHKGNIREISDRIAMSKAGVCSAAYEEIVFALSDNHKKLKKLLLNSDAYYMMFPDRVKKMFSERNSENCKSCCVSHGGGAPPDRCGITDYELPRYNQSFFGIMPFYTYNDNSPGNYFIPLWKINIGTVYAKLKKINERDKREIWIDSTINSLVSYMSLFDEEIKNKENKSSDIKGLLHFKYRPEASYNLSKLYYLKGDREKSKKYLLDTIIYSEGIDVGPELSRERLLKGYERM